MEYNHQPHHHLDTVGLVLLCIAKYHYNSFLVQPLETEESLTSAYFIGKSISTSLTLHSHHLNAMADSYTPIYSIGSFVVLVLDIMAIYEVFKSERDVPMKLLWFLFILFFPIVGALCYFLLASRPTGYRAIA